MSMSQRSFAASAQRRPYDSTPFLSHARSFSPSVRAERRFWEFFTAHIRNPNTRLAYLAAVRRFAEWCERRGLALDQVEPMVVAAYIEQLSGAFAPASVKQHLAALRMLFDWLVVGQVLPFNPASSVRGPKHVIKTGKTPVLSAKERNAARGGVQARSAGSSRVGSSASMSASDSALGSPGTPLAGSCEPGRRDALQDRAMSRLSALKMIKRWVRKVNAVCRGRYEFHAWRRLSRHCPLRDAGAGGDCRAAGPFRIMRGTHAVMTACGSAGQAIGNPGHDRHGEPGVGRVAARDQVGVRRRDVRDRQRQRVRRQRRNRRAALCLPVIGKRGKKSNGEPEWGTPECWPNSAAYPFASTASRRRQFSHRIFAKRGRFFNKQTSLCRSRRHLTNQPDFATEPESHTVCHLS